MYLFYALISVIFIIAPWSLLFTIFLDGKFAAFPGIYHRFELYLGFRILSIYSPIIILLTYYSKKNREFLRFFIFLINLIFTSIFFYFFSTRTNFCFSLRYFSLIEIYLFILALTLFLSILIFAINYFFTLALKLNFYPFKFFIKEFIALASNQKRTILLSFIFVSLIYLIIFWIAADLFLILNS